MSTTSEPASVEKPAEAPESPPPPDDFEAFDIVRVALGMLILCAAALKMHELLTRPVAGSGFLNLYGMRLSIIEAELVLSTWLLSGYLTRVSHRIAVATMAVFCGVALWKAIEGAASCGCFGSVAIDPKITFLMDLGIVLALLRWPPAAELRRVRPTKWQLAFFVLVLAGGGVFAGIAIPRAPTREVPPADEESGDKGQPVILEPQTWSGKSLPILDHIESDARLGSGRWLLVLYHNGCSVCQQVVPEFQVLASNWSREEGRPRVAFIDVPDEFDTAPEQVGADKVYARGRMSEAHEWFVITPAVLLIEDGRVRRVFTHEEVASPEMVQATFAEPLD
jgi:hypothetical protein